MKINSAVLTLLLSICTFCSAFAQAPDIQWSKCYGGTFADGAEYLQVTSDGGYVLIGSTRSYNGDVSGNHDTTNSFEDWWIVKVDNSGNIQWKNCFGGTWYDKAYSALQTSDGGYIVTGWAGSTDGDVVNSHGDDCWVIKLDSLGFIQWQKCLGGSALEEGFSIQPTNDGGFIIGGQASSIDGDVTGFHGYLDYWIVKIDSLGNIQWQRCLGGTQNEYCMSARQTSDGGYILAGSTRSEDGDVTGSPDPIFFNCWILKLDSLGDIQWQKCFGGTQDDYAFDILETTDSGYILTGEPSSNDVDVTGNHGYSDVWIVKMNSNGNILWQKCLGGTSGEFPGKIERTNDNGFIIPCTTFSNDGDVSGNHGSQDYWIVKIDSVGNLEWQKCMGGSSSDAARSIHQTADSGYAVLGSAYSSDGDVSGHHGNTDYWLVKLVPDYTAIPEISLSNMTAFISQSDNLSLTFSSRQPANLQLAVGDITGRTLFQTQLTASSGINKKEMKVGDLAGGIYIVTLIGEEGRESLKVVKE